MANWKKLCESRKNLVKPWSSKKLIIQDLNNVFDQLKVSHLQVYDPASVRKYWHGDVLETGIESRFVEGELVVTYVHKGSAAEKAGVRLFDIIQAINQEHPSEKNASESSGEFLLLRQGKKLTLQIKANDFTKSDRMEVQTFQDYFVLRIPSFRESVFQGNAWQVELEKLKGKANIIVDLRGNAGGNFFAGLAILSHFVCDVSEVGILKRPRFLNLPKKELPSKLDDQFHIRQLKSSSILSLKTFRVETCLTHPKAVLVDAGTSSVAEMVTQGFRELVKAPILGSVTAGKLLVGMWYPWPDLGPGVEISIPEAIYLSRNGVNLEEAGVAPDKSLFYRLNDFNNGRDSWLEQAMRYRP